MIQRLRDRQQNEQGFTLVELLVVIVILGILASIVVFAVGGITDKGEEKAKATDISVIETAEEAFYANEDKSVYTDEDGLVTAGFLRAVSNRVDVCLAGDAKSYTIADQDGCTP